MLGRLNDPDGQPDLPGVIPRCCEGIFAAIEAHKARNKHNTGSLSIQVIEVYVEKVHDLLIPNAKWEAGGIKLKFGKNGYENPGRGQPLLSVSDLAKVIANVDRNRSVDATPGNLRSSRAHTIYTMTYTTGTYEGLNADGAPEITTRSSFINLIDLAGTEDASKVWDNDKLFREGVTINKSLGTLRDCIKQLTKIKPGQDTSKILAFNGSKLTQVLRFPLTSGKVCVLGAMSPDVKMIDATLGTLGFLKDCKDVITRSKKNVTRNVAKELEEELAKVRAERDAEVARLMAELEAERANRTNAIDQEKLREIMAELESEREARERAEEEYKQKLAATTETEEQRKAREAEIRAKFEQEWADTMKKSNMTSEAVETITVPYISNLSSEPALCGKIVYKIADVGRKYLVGGRGDRKVRPDILLNSVGVIPEHATLEWAKEQDSYATDAVLVGRSGSNANSGNFGRSANSPGGSGGSRAFGDDSATPGMRIQPTAQTGLGGSAGGSPLPAREYLYITVGARHLDPTPVFVNGIPLKAGDKQELRHWDLIWIGPNAVFRVQFPGQEIYRRRIRKHAVAAAAAAGALVGSGSVSGLSPNPAAAAVAASGMGTSSLTSGFGGLARVGSMAAPARTEAPGWEMAVSMMRMYEDWLRKQNPAGGDGEFDAALDRQLVDGIGKTRQATAAAATIGVDAVFTLKLITDRLTRQKVLMVRAMLGGAEYLWSMEKFDQRLSLIMQAYDDYYRCQDAGKPYTPPVTDAATATARQREGNPFLDDEHQFIGDARIYLDSLKNMMPDSLPASPILNHSSVHVASLNAFFSPLDAEGGEGPWPDEKIDLDPFVEDLEELLGQEIRVVVRMNGITWKDVDVSKGEQVPFRDVFLRFIFNVHDSMDAWIDSDRVAEPCMAPVFKNASHTYTFKVTDKFLAYVRKNGCVLVQLWGKPTSTGGCVIGPKTLPPGWSLVNVVVPAFRAPDGSFYLAEPNADGTPNGTPIQH